MSPIISTGDCAGRDYLRSWFGTYRRIRKNTAFIIGGVKYTVKALEAMHYDTAISLLRQHSSEKIARLGREKSRACQGASPAKRQAIERADQGKVLRSEMAKARRKMRRRELANA